MSGPWLDILAYLFVYAPGLVFLALYLAKIIDLIIKRRDQSEQLQTDWQLDYFMDEAKQLMAERRRVQRQRDAMALRNALHWPPKRPHR